MKAWLYRRHGGPEVLELAEIDRPQPGRGELLVKVLAFAINPLDWKLRAGQYRWMVRGGMPRGVGYDVAGVAEANGAQTRTAPGTRIVSMINPYASRSGAAAEYAVVQEKLAVPLPDGLAATDAAALPGAGLTARQALRKARVRSGQRALVLGASGGVGSYAVLLAMLEGAEVTAVASAAGQAHLARLAPQRAVDSSREDWRRLPGPFDLVLDCTGATTFAQCRHLLAPAGVYANTLPDGAMYRDALWAALTSRQRVIPVMERPVREDLEHLVRLAASGRLRAPVTRVASMAEVPDLERELEAGRGRGKFVVSLA